MEAIESLNLPKPEIVPKGRRGGAGRKEIKLLPHHLIQTIDLSGFKERRISRSGIRELLDGLELLPCIRSLNLSNNGITDDFDKEILAIFDLHKIKAIDLSFNHMKALGL
jgi:Leucine-rich repeat (LRR) protein